ncbi:hypothetical protein GCM10009799_11100 [Nocardiopsis rhodophaea]|uniref:Uncharacterized protein n=1 Tax=Nocardiopsis rhodophaea TaxID=280238 RepID=A0ABN2SIE8_9ACTN
MPIPAGTWTPAPGSPERASFIVSSIPGVTAPEAPTPTVPPHDSAGAPPLRPPQLWTTDVLTTAGADPAHADPGSAAPSGANPRIRRPDGTAPGRIVSCRPRPRQW